MPATDADPGEIRLLAADLLDRLERLRAEAAAEAADLLAGWRPVLEREAFAESAANFAAYLALRRRDLRPLQAELAPFGLSSLGRLEGRVLANLDAVIAALAAVAGTDPRRWPGREAFFRGDALLAEAADHVLGPRRDGGRRVRILVTCGREAAEDPDFMREIVRRGADAVRLNCAHDDADAWAAMIRHLRAAEAEAGRRLKVLMDLGGPKVRTGRVRLPGDRKRLKAGDHLLLVRPGALDAVPDGPAFRAECAEPKALERLRPDEPVLIDDGKVRGVIERAGPEGALVRIERTPPEGAKLKPEKGLNFPRSELDLAPLSADDLRDLDFVAANADLVGYSFVQSAADIALLQDELRHRRPDPGWRELGIVAKIETPRAVQSLPEIVVGAAGRQPLAVMIARGDLAVEIGFERLAEMQEEILWLCEAAHVPVIWATQVLEGLVKKGLPSRGEMTDAAMGARAECVMLNRGPYVADAVSALDRLLTRMAEHQTKKTAQLRALRSWA
jgi:pyruvate kinase